MMIAVKIKETNSDTWIRILFCTRSCLKKKKEIRKPQWHLMRKQINHFGNG